MIQMNRALILFSLIVITGWSNAQTLNDQFNTLKEDAGNYKQFKVIDEAALNNFWKTTMDSVRSLKNEKANLIGENSQKESNIRQLETTIDAKDDQIEALETQTSSISVFGAVMEKSTFIFISFFTIGALVVVLLLLLYQYKDNNKVAKEKVKAYDKLNNDFEEYKRNALEKQMKLRRDLQTERNKLEEARKN